MQIASIELFKLAREDGWFVTQNGVGESRLSVGQLRHECLFMYAIARTYIMLFTKPVMKYQLFINSVTMLGRDQLLESRFYLRFDNNIPLTYSRNCTSPLLHRHYNNSGKC